MKNENVNFPLSLQDIMEHLSVIKQIDGGLLKNELEY